MIQHVKIEIRELESRQSSFRFETFKQARTRHLKGYVKSVSPASLIIVAEGDSNDISEFIDWCHTFFNVRNDHVQCSVQSRSNMYNDFLIMD